MIVLQVMIHGIIFTSEITNCSELGYFKNTKYGFSSLNKTIRNISYQINWESRAQFENRIKPRMYVRHITHSTMYEKAPFC